MARYFFDINDGQNREVDESGLDLPHLSAARAAAMEELILLLKDNVPDGDRETYVVTVRDASQAPLLVATATIVCEVIGKRS